MKTQKTPNSQNNFEVEQTGVMLPDFRLYYKATIIKTVVFAQRYPDQCNKSTEINPHTTSQLIYDKGGEKVQ